jgi:hypothetical protein
LEDITRDEKKAFAPVEVDNPDINICVWRLFDVNQTSQYNKLKYSFLYDDSKSQNVEFVLFDYDLATNTSKILEDHSGEEESLVVVDMIHLAEEAEDKPVKVKWVDFKHSDLYLIARKVNLQDPTFKINFEFNYVHAPGIS